MTRAKHLLFDVLMLPGALMFIAAGWWCEGVKHIERKIQ